MADLKTTTVTGSLTASGVVTGATVQSTNAASAPNDCVRKVENDSLLAGKVDTSDSRLTDPRTTTGTAAGGEIVGNFPNDLRVEDRTINQGLATPGNVGPLTSLLSWLAGAIKAATGTTNWFDAPATTLATTAAHIASTANPHAVTATQVGLGNVSNNAQLVAANNLSDVANVGTSRTNLGLGGAAVLAVGTTAGTVAAGDDSRMTNSRAPVAHATSHKLAGSDPIRLDELAAPTATVSFNSQVASALAAPVLGGDAANKDYVDAGKALFRARLAATTNISLSGVGGTLDGVVVAATNRIAVMAQTTGSQNGIYVAASGAWTRATDADTGAELASGSIITVAEGTLGAGMWRLMTADPIVIGTTATVWAQWPAAGSGLSQTGGSLTLSAGGVTDTFIGNRTVNQALATPADTGILTSLLSWIAGRLMAITGKADWKTAPATTLELASAHISAVTGNPHAVTKTDVGLSAVTNALQLVAANNLSDLASAATARANLGLLGSSILAVGTTAGTVAAGDDARFGVKLGNVIWVDAVNGNDGTGLRGRLDKPFLTCGAAKTAASSGDVIYVLPGTYNEKNLLKDGVNFYFLPGAVINYTGGGNGAIFDDGVNGLNSSANVTVYGNGQFTNGSGGTGPAVYNITKTGSRFTIQAEKLSSTNTYAGIATNGKVTIRCNRIDGGILHDGSDFPATYDQPHYVACQSIFGGVNEAVYLKSGYSVIVGDLITAPIGNGLRIKNGINEVTARLISSGGDVGCLVEAPSATQRCRVINAKIQSTLNTAAGRAVTIASDNLVLQNCVLVSNVVGTPAVESVYAAAAQNLRVYGHSMANLAKHVNVTLLCGTLEVDTDVI